MEVSQNGINLIKKYEGCRLDAYLCPANVWTIGFGHTGSDVFKGRRITHQEAEKLLKIDLLVHSNNVNKLVKVKLNQNQFAALVSFEYNVGYGNFKSSTLLRLLNQGKYKDAGEQFNRWVYAGGKVLAGLQKRRAEEKALFLKPFC